MAAISNILVKLHIEFVKEYIFYIGKQLADAVIAFANSYSNISHINIKSSLNSIVLLPPNEAEV